MTRQRNMFQMKAQGKTPEERLSELETGNLPDKEFKVKIVKMIQELKKNGSKSSKFLTKSQKI